MRDVCFTMAKTKDTLKGKDDKSPRFSLGASVINRPRPWSGLNMWKVVPMHRLSVPRPTNSREPRPWRPVHWNWKRLQLDNTCRHWGWTSRVLLKGLWAKTLSSKVNFWNTIWLYIFATWQPIACVLITRSSNFGRMIVHWHRLNWPPKVHSRASKMRSCCLNLEISYAHLKSSFAQNIPRDAQLQ
jgi:hypothetical protein